MANKKRALITGITGFVGSHLAELLLNEKNVIVYGTMRWRSKTENIDHVKDKIKLYECDIRDASSIKNLLVNVRPDIIFHLSAQSFVHTSWHAPAETLITNAIGQLNLFEAVRYLGMDPIIHIAGSSEEYGMALKKELPIKETNPLRPLSPYAVSKVTQDLLGYQYFQSYKMRIIRTRAFNHTGPRRGEVFVSSNFARQLALIEAGLQGPVVKVGNLQAKRDFTDVRDIVRAYWLCVQKGEIGEVYNICSGNAYTIGEILDILLSMMELKVKIEQESSRLRPSDVPVLIGDSSKFRKRVGWKPQIPFRQTLKDLLDYWREKVRTENAKFIKR